MIFEEAIAIVKTVLHSTGTEISEDNYDGLIVKKLESSNTLDSGRVSHQTHIALTGDQMDLFPYLKADGYFDRDQDGFKKYFIERIPVTLSKTNTDYLASHEIGEKLSLEGAVCQTHTSVVRSKRVAQSDQIQLSMLNYDGAEFVALRKMLHTGDYIVFLKKKKQFSYDVFGIKKNDGELEGFDLRPLNNEIFILKTTTAIDIDSLVDPGDKNGGSTLPIKALGGYNKIFYGAPGCGKSYFVKNDILKNGGVRKEDYFRTTFHPDYSNSDFVGQIMPKVKADKSVTYDFVPGPFALALKRSYETGKMVYLVIEEINRGNASAIFGDLFQLLDRKKDPADSEFGASEYGIINVALQEWLSQELSKEMKEIVVPSNLTILATMNSSDQNVFTLDTAFKRRWAFEQINNDIDADTKHPYKNWFVPGTNITWATFLNKVNERILDFKIANSSNEDKRLGKYFVTKDCLTETAKVIGDCEAEANNFAYKVLEYLWNDVCKFNPEAMFDVAGNKNQTLEDLIENFKKEQLNVFSTIDFNE